MHVWRTLDKATPMLAGQALHEKTRVRHDRVDDTRCVTLRNRRRMHHIGLGRRCRGERVIILMADLDVRVITEDGELMRHFTPPRTTSREETTSHRGFVGPRKSDTSQWWARGDLNPHILSNTGT